MVEEKRFVKGTTMEDPVLLRACVSACVSKCASFCKSIM